MIEVFTNPYLYIKKIPNSVTDALYSELDTLESDARPWHFFSAAENVMAWAESQDCLQAKVLAMAKMSRVIMAVKTAYCGIQSGNSSYVPELDKLETRCFELFFKAVKIMPLVEQFEASVAAIGIATSQSKIGAESQNIKHTATRSGVRLAKSLDNWDL